ncbi:MAG: hypothetical protein MUP63_00980 [Candidatus Nanohaloarchaeota archaeon QJJ-7]|nr:hypothetical protein [Candidatus Nanohaloarchaeota archaeon QJJ-7]
MKTKIWALLVSVMIAGCTATTIPEEISGGKAASTSVGEIKFESTPALGKTVNFSFSVRTNKNISDLRVRLHTPQKVDVKGRSVWTQDVVSGNRHKFGAALLFTNPGLYTISAMTERNLTNDTERPRLVRNSKHLWVNISQNGSDIYRNKHPSRLS